MRDSADNLMFQNKIHSAYISVRDMETVTLDPQKYASASQAHYCLQMYQNHSLIERDGQFSL